MFGFKFHLMSPHYVPDAQKDFFNYIYSTWKTTFTDVVESAGGKLDPDDFFRNDHICVITHNHKIVCLWTMTMFDIDLHSSREHHYIQALKQSSCNELAQTHLKRLVSIEYLNILPEWRRTAGNIAWVEVITGLGALIMDSSSADAMIGTPRIDLKVDQLATNVGALLLQEPILKMNYPCAVMVMAKAPSRTFKNEVTHQYVHALFRDMNIIGPNAFQISENNKKKAA